MPGSRSPFLILTRIGFAARGLMYLIVAYLALRLGRAADAEGALEYLNSGAGRALLAAMAIGFAAYGVWRLADATLDLDGQGGDAKGVAVRLAHGASGFIHLWLGWETAEIVFGSRSGEEGREATEAGAATAMSLPGRRRAGAGRRGRAAGGRRLPARPCAERRFLRRLAPAASNKGWVMLAGMLGYAARGAVFVIAAWLLYRAWSASSPAAAGGLGDVLTWLTGPLRAVAAGLAAFGVFSLIEARYRCRRIRISATGSSRRWTAGRQPGMCGCATMQ